MTSTRSNAIVGVAGIALGALALAGCGSNNNGGSGGSSTGTSSAPSSGSSASGSGGSGGIQCASGTLNGAGSTFQTNIEQQWIKNYTAKCSGAQINYQSIGSGAGITEFGNGTSDFAGSDVVMKPSEQAKANSRCGGPAIHIPIISGGTALEYNLPSVKNLQLSAKTIAGIFDGTIKKWNDPAVKADNPGVTLPSTTVVSVHRSDSSGTTGIFTGFVAATAGSSWKLGSGKSVNWPAGQAAKGSSGVTATVKQTTGSIGYAEYSYPIAAGLPVAKVKGSGSSYVALNEANVSAFMAAAFKVTGSGDNMAGTVDFTSPTGYPISSVTYVIACQTGKDAAKATLLRDYLHYALTAGQSAASGLAYAALPSAIDGKAVTAAASLK